MIKTPSISTFLWFDRNAEAAAEFYTTLFPNPGSLLHVLPRSRRALTWC